MTPARLRLTFLCVVLAGAWLAGTASASAAPAYPYERTFEQADGTEITLVRWGDEFVNGWETPHGHTVIRNDRSGNWEYAERGRNGELQSSGRTVGRDAAPGQTGVRPSEAAYERARRDFHAANASSGGSGPAAPTVGSTATAAPAWSGSDTDLLFLAVEFSDVACSFTVSEHQANMFGGAASGPGDLDDYYREISYGKLELDGVVVGDNADGCITLADTKATYDTGSKNAGDVVAEAVAAADGYTDFSAYDNDGDGNVDAMGIIYAGGGPHDGCDTDDGASGSGGDNLWPHSSSVGGISVDGVTVSPYIINSEVTFPIGSSTCSVIQTVGLFAHEFGHSLGLPDFYDTDGSSEGIGWWSTMASQYRSTVNLADTPPHFDAFAKWWLGWITPVDRTTFEGNGPIQQVATTGEAYRLGTNPGGPEIGGSGEYWLLENRQQVGFDAQLPGCGLLIWHIEESMTHNRNEGHTTASHRLIDLEEADGLDHLDANDTNRGDTGDPYPGSTNNRLFNDVSYPTANYYDGSPSGFRVADISGCDDVMTANFGNPSADLQVSKSADRSEAFAGETLRYTITVHNNGPATADGIVVTDTLPTGVTYQTGPSYCAESGGVVTCTPSQMLSGQTTTFFVQVVIHHDAVATSGGSGYLSNRVAVTADQPDDDLTNNSDTADTIITDNADLGVTKTCKPDEVADAGSEAFCDLSVHNFGPSTARSVVLTDDIVSNSPFTVLGVSSGCSQSSITNGQRVTCAMGAVAAGATETVTVRFTSDVSGDVNDTLRSTSATPDPDSSNDIATESVTFRAVADLSLTKTDNPDPVVAGEEITYVLTAINHGPSPATNVLVVDQLPAQVSVVSVTPSAPGSCTIGVPGDAARPTGCQFGTLANGASRTVTIVATVNPAATGLLTNDGWVSSADHDPDNGDDVASTTTSVISKADLAVVKVSTPNPVVAGEMLHHTLTVTNDGPSLARGVHLEDELPDGTTFVSATVQGGAGTCTLIDVPPDTVMCDLVDLAPGQSLAVYIDVDVDASVLDGTVLTNTAVVSSQANDPDPSDNEASASVTASTLADLSVDKVGTVDTQNPSSTIEYVITATNAGPSDAQDVVIVDTLPSVTKGGQQKVTFVHATDGCTYDAASHSVTCDVGVLADGSTYEARIYIQFSGKEKLTNVVDVFSSTNDPVSDNNTDTFQLTVEGGSNRPGGPGKKS